MTTDPSITQAIDLTTPDAELYRRAGLEVVPTSDVIGAEIRGIKLSEAMDDATFAAVYRALLKYCVILFRDQILSEADLVAFSRRFGDLDHGPKMERTPKEPQRFPEIFVVSNIIENGKAIGYFSNEELDWHTDMCHAEFPPKACTLYAIEVPDDDSAPTGFMNLHLVYENLPKALYGKIENLEMRHDPGHTLQGDLRYGYDPADYENIETAPGPAHPLVPTHPETGRKALYLGRQWNGKYRNGFILGLSREDSDALQDELWDYVRQAKFAWHHHWKAGDYVMWDNRCVMHRRPAFDAASRRIMHRTQIRSEKRLF